MHEIVTNFQFFRRANTLVDCGQSRSAGVYWGVGLCQHATKHGRNEGEERRWETKEKLKGSGVEFASLATGDRRRSVKLLSPEQNWSQVASTHFFFLLEEANSLMECTV